MKICSVCNAQNADDAQFCTSCGQVLTENTQQTNPTTLNKPVYEQPQNSQNQNYNAPNNQMNGNSNVNTIRPTGNGRFVNADEYTIATLKNGIAMNIISGEGFKNEDAILTNRRLYYNHKDGIINVRKCEEKIDVKDITGTKIVTFSPYGMLILSILMFLVGIAISGGVVSIISFTFVFLSIILIVVFVSLEKKYLKIEYAGGAIHFSVKKYGMQNIQLFQKCIHAVKDSIEDNK